MVLSNQLSNALWSYRDYLFASGEVFSVPISWQNAFIRHGMTPSNAKKCHQIGPSSIFLKTINYKYVGAIHHGVPYELCHEVLSQKNIFFVMPKFKSYCAYHMTAEDLKLPPDMQILAAKKWLRALPDSNLQKFGLCQRDIDRIKNNNFSSFTWHHSGRKELSLVDSCVHSKCRHTGYASIFFSGYSR